MPVSPGAVVLGRFRVRGPAGREGGAQLFDAQEIAGDARSVRIAAVSVPPGTTASSADVVERASRYTLGIVGLDRPIAVGRKGEQILLAYPTSGRTLADDIDAGPTSAAAVAEWLRPIAKALETLHEQGVAFGHVRPDLISRSGERTRLGGFGVWHIADAFGGAKLGCDALPVEYRAPEQLGASPSPAETWSDVYTLGVVALELVAGGRVRSDLYRPPTVDDMDASISDAVRTVLEHALNASASARPTSARRWVNELAAAAQAPEIESMAGAVSEAPLLGGALPAVSPAGPPGNEVSARERVEAPLEPSGQEPIDGDHPPIGPTAAEADPRAGSPGRGGEPPERAPKPDAKRVLAKPKEGTFLMAAAIIGGFFLLFVGATGALIYVLMQPTPRTATAPVAPTPGFGPAPTPPTTTDAGRPRAPEIAPPDPDEPPLPSTPLAFESGPKVHAAESRAMLPMDGNVGVLGNRDAHVTILVFGDLRCPHTAKAVPDLERLVRAMKGQARVAWRHRPLTSHPRSRDTALAAEGVLRDSGHDAFWRFVRVAVSKSAGGPLDDAELRTWLRRAGGDPSKLSSYLTDPALAARVDADVSLAGRFMVHATPTFFVNGVRMLGNHPFPVLKKLVEREARESRSTLVSGVEQPELYGARVRKNLVNLGPEVLARNCVPVGSSPKRGADEPLVTIVEFSEFECQYCADVQPTLDGLLARYGGDLQLVWKHYPLPSHARARPAAIFAAEAFARGGDTKFWRVHDLLFAAKGSLDDSALGAIAKRARLPEVAMLDAVRRGDRGREVDADVALGEKHDVAGTPVFLVNGRSIRGAQAPAVFRKTIDEEIETARRLLANGTDRRRMYPAVCGFEP